MKAMILAAGLGKRMLPLTENLPKPLLQVAGKSLIQYQIERLVANGIHDIVINHCYHGDQIESHLGDGARLGASIQYSRETLRLETAGGIIRALPLLEDDCFVVVNADVWTDFPFASLQPVDGSDNLAHLVLVPNTEHHPHGDFYLGSTGRIHPELQVQDQRLTFSGISVLHRELFSAHPAGPLPLLPVLNQAIDEGRVRGEIFTGTWIDIGTPERLQQLNDIESRRTVE